MAKALSFKGQGAGDVAQQKVIKLVDDLDGSKAVETVSFGIDGALYDIDLNAKNAAKLRSALDRFVAAGRKSRPQIARRLPRRSGAAKIVGGSSLADVRTWANGNGYKVAERGRIPADVTAAFNAAQSG